MKSAKDINELLLEVVQNKDTCLNGTVIYFVNELKSDIKGKKKPIPYTSVAAKLCGTFSSDAPIYYLKPLIQRTYDVFKKISKTPERNWTQLVSFIKTPFPVICPADKQPSDLSLSVGLQNVIPPVIHNSKPSPSSPIKTRRDCGNCSVIKKTNMLLKGSLAQKKGTIQELKAAAALKKKNCFLRAKNQNIKRKEEKIKALKRDLKKFKIKINQQGKRLYASNCEINLLRKEHCKLQSENGNLKKQITDLNKLVKTKEKSLKDEQKYSEMLIAIIEEKDCARSTTVVSEFKSKCGKSYNNNIRRCIYSCLVYDVPVKNCGVLIKFIVETLTGTVMSDVPSPSTCSQMAYELGVLATIQIMDFMMNETSLCLSWDATTIEGAHINEIHVTANKTNCLVLDVRHIPGGTSTDYVSHIMGSLAEAASTYAKYKGCSEHNVLLTLKSKIASTLTDRAAVNGAVTRQLCSELDTELLMLNCNIHPLDSVARDVKAALVKLESSLAIRGDCFGFEGTAANLIKAISVLRYKDGKGDPIGFKNFLRLHDIPVTAFPRYVGNRLHVLFHLAGVIIRHEAQLLEFLEKKCTAGGLLRSRTMKDLKNSKIMVQMWVLAAIGKTFSGPWMTKFYSSTMANLEMRPLVQCCVTQLQNWIGHPHSFICLRVNVFDEQLDPPNDDVLSALHDYNISDSNFLIQSSTTVLTSVLSVVLRQLGSFVDGIYSQPSAEMMELAASAPTHNMSSERTLGSFDRMSRRAPIATMGFLNGKVKTKMNKTMRWLDERSCEEKKSLIEFASREAREEKCRKLIEHKSLHEEISKRRLEVEKKRRKTKKTAIVRDLNKSFSKMQVVSTSYSDDAIRNIVNYIHSPESVVGTLFIHDMFEDGQKYGRIQKIQKNNKLLVAYWNLEEMEANGHDCSVSASSFFADLVLGHVIML